MAGIAPGERPGHGASATTSKTHTSILERLEGRTTDWNERVSDEQYLVEAQSEQKVISDFERKN